MPQIRDRRRRIDMDLFILALIDSGVSTPYDFQKAAGLSQGATIPALQRLLKARFVRLSRPAARSRSSYSISATGKRLLRDGWLPLIEAGPSGDLDSDLRVALLALWGSGDRRLAVDFLRQSADKLESSSAAKRVADLNALAPIARWYVELRYKTAKALVIAESRGIRAMADDLPRSLTANSRHKALAISKQERS